MDAQAGYQAAVERARLLPSAALVPGVNPPMLSPTFGDTPVGLGAPYPGQTMAELAAAGGGGLSPTAVAYVPFHSRYVPAAHALSLHGSGGGYSSLVGQFLRAAAVANPGPPAHASVGDHYKDMLAAGHLQRYWQAMTQPADTEDCMRGGLYPNYGTQCVSLMPGAVAPDRDLLIPGSIPDVCRRAHDLHTEALLYHCAGAGAGVSAPSLPPAFLTAPPASLSAGLTPADAARVAAKVSPPARTKSRSRTPKTVAKRDDGSTAARTVAHAEPPNRVHAYGKTGRRDSADSAELTRKRRAEMSPDSSARKQRRMRSDSTTTSSVRSAAGDASPRLNGSDARQEKRAEKPGAEKDCETSPETSVSRSDRKSRSATSGHSATIAAVISSRAGYKSPPVTGESAADPKQRVSLAGSGGAAVSSSCLLTGYHCTVTQLGLSPSSRTVHAPTFTPEVGTVFDGPVSASTSPAAGKPLKTSPGSSPETVRLCSVTVDGGVKADKVDMTSQQSERSSNIECNQTTSPDKEAAGESSDSKTSSTSTSTAKATGTAPKVKVEHAVSSIASPGGKGNATPTAKHSESSSAVGDSDAHNATAPPLSTSVHSSAEGNAAAVFASANSGNNFGLADMNVSCGVYPPRLSRPIGDDVAGYSPMLPVPQPMGSGFYTDEDRRRLAVSAGGWLRTPVAVASDYTLPIPIPSASYSPAGSASVPPGRTVGPVPSVVGVHSADSEVVVDLSAGSSRCNEKSTERGCSSRRNTGGSLRDKYRTADLSGDVSRGAANSSRTKQKTIAVSSNSSKGHRKSADNGTSPSPKADSAAGGNWVVDNDDIVDLSAGRTNRSAADVNANSSVDVNSGRSELKTEKSEPVASRRSPTNRRLDVKEELVDTERKGSHSDTPPCLGSIPIGIAIARQRDAKHAKKDADEGTDEDTQQTCHSSGVFGQPSHQGQPVHHITRDEQSVPGGPLTEELHKLPKGLTDMPTHITSNLVVTHAPDVTAAMWPQQSVSGSVQPHVTRPWMETNASVNPTMWLGQGAFNVPHPPDPTQLPLAPHTEIKLVQHPITGQLYIIPRVNWPSYPPGLQAPPQFAPGLEQQAMKDESALTGRCCPSESTARPGDCPAMVHMLTDSKKGEDFYGSSQLSRAGDVQPHHPFLPGVGLETGQHPYHLPCPPPPPAHLRYYYDPSCFVRVAPNHDVFVTQPKEPTTPPKMETHSENIVVETSSTLHANGSTTKQEVGVHTSEAESSCETADTDTTGEIARKTEITTKSEKISAEDGLLTRETVNVLATFPKTEAVLTESVSANGNVATKLENAAEAAKSKLSRCKQRRTAVESTLRSKTDTTETMPKKEEQKTDTTLGGLHALYVASLQLRSETSPKTTAHTDTPLDGLQLLCSAMERAQKAPSNAGCRSDAKAASPAPCAATTGSPDLEKNYNAPKKGSFTPLKTSLLRKDETGEWCSSPLKIGLENMDVLELEMRVRLAELQKKYKEKQRELARLQPRRNSEKDDEKQAKRRPGRPRKKSVKTAHKVETVTSLTATSASSKVTPVKSDVSLLSKKKRRKKVLPKSVDINAPAPQPKPVTDGKAKVKANPSEKVPQKSCPPDDTVRLSKKLDVAKMTTKKRLFTNVADKPSVTVPKTAISPVKSPKPASTKGPSHQSLETAHPTKHGHPEKTSTHANRISTAKKIQKEKPPMLKTETSGQEDLSWLLGDGWQRSVSDSSAKKVVTKPPKLAASPESSSFGDVKWPTSRTPEKCENIHKDGFHDNDDLGHQYTSKKVEIMQTSVAAATSAALKSKKRKRLEDGSGLVSFVDEAPVKKRKPGRPKKFILTGKVGTETIVAKKPRHLTFFPSPPRSPSPEPRKQDLRLSPKNEELPFFLNEDWRRRRSERIFLNDFDSPKAFKSPVALGSPTRTKLTLPKPTTPISPHRELSSPKVTMVSTVRPKVAAPTLTTPSTCGGVTTTTSSSAMTSGRSSTSAADERSRIKCMHDISQKLKKKYSKSARKPDARKLPTVPANKCTQPKPKPQQAPAQPASKPLPQKQPPQIFTYQKYYYSSDSESVASTDEEDDVPLSSYVEKSLAPVWPTPETPSCIIHDGDLRDGLRVLLFLEHLFFEGQVRGIHPPDVYGVLIDGERGNRPHVFSQEEVLKLAVLDVKPPSPEALPDGARVCAYWSQQFRCLYPGTVSTDSPNPDSDPDLVTVEFDDGDSGRIPISHIRMLPPDFPVQGAVPEVVGKRRRRTVSEDLLADTKERRPSISDTVCSYQLSDNTGLRQRRAAKRSDPVITSHTGGTPRERHVQKKANSQEQKVRSIKHKNDRRRSVFASNPQRSRDSRSKPALQAKAKDNVASIGRKDRGVLPSSKNRLKMADAKAESGDDSDSDESGLSDVTEDDVSSSELSESETKKTKKNRQKKRRNGKVRGFVAGGRQWWQWLGTSTRRPGMKGRARKEFYKAIKRGHETIRVGDAAVFTSTGHNRLPYIGRIVSMWEAWGGNKVVKVKWFYHPEETKGGKRLAELMGALYLSPHTDENDVQTISHRIEVVSYTQYQRGHSQSKSSHGTAALKRSDLYYLAGTYHPTIGMIQFEPDVKLI